MTPPASQHQYSQYNLTAINWMPILYKTAAASQWMSIRSEVVLVCILHCEFTGTCSYGIYHQIHIHTHKYYMQKNKIGITNIPACLFSESSSQIKTFLWLEERKKKKRKTSSHTHPPRQYHPHTESGEGQHVMNIVNINSFRSTWLCMHLMKHAPFI